MNLHFYSKTTSLNIQYSQNFMRAFNFDFNDEICFACIFFLAKA